MHLDCDQLGSILGNAARISQGTPLQRACLIRQSDIFCALCTLTQDDELRGCKLPTPVAQWDHAMRILHCLHPQDPEVTAAFHLARAQHDLEKACRHLEHAKKALCARKGPKT